MSSGALNWAKRVKVGDATRKAILMVLADYADEQASCFPSQSTIADESEAAERTVRRVLAEFEDRGLIRRERRSGGNYGRSSDRIYLNLGWSAEADAASQANHPERPTQPATVSGSGWDATGQRDRKDAVRNRPLTTTQPATHDHATGHSLAAEPPRTTKNRVSQSSSSLHRGADRHDDDDRIAAAARLHAIGALDRRRQAEAEGKQLDVVEDVTAWLDGVAARWRRERADDIARILAEWPDLEPEDLVDHCRSLAVRRILRVAEAEPVPHGACGVCGGRVWLDDDATEACPQCRPDLSAGNITTEGAS